MHRLWDIVIEPVLAAVRPRVVVEIGTGRGETTSRLLDYLKEGEAVVHTIDPSPKLDPEEWQERYGELAVFHRAKSLDALPNIRRPELVLIDGDHNWYTVTRELELLDKQARRGKQRFPVVILHDIDWPYARRDLYYDPDSIPEAYRHPHERRGVVPNQSALAEDGGLNADLYNARHEGGPRNGVRTAMEDFIEETETDLVSIEVPGLFGLGVLLPKPLLDEPECSKLARRLRSAALLRRQVVAVERARLESEVALWKTKRGGKAKRWRRGRRRKGQQVRGARGR